VASAAAGAAANAAPYKMVRARTVIPPDDPPSTQKDADARPVETRAPDIRTPDARASDVRTPEARTADVPPTPSAPATKMVVVAKAVAASERIVAQGDADPASDGEAGDVGSTSLLSDVGGGALRPMLIVLAAALVGVFGLQMVVFGASRRRRGATAS
jgi:hypothetical protein